jgi:hexosaminidase
MEAIAKAMSHIPKKHRHAATLLLALPLLAACAPAAVSHSVVPVPASIRVDDDRLALDSTMVIAVRGGEEAERVGEQLAAIIGFRPELRPRVIDADAPQGAGAAVTLAVDPAARDRLGPEGYDLVVDASGIRIGAAAPAGLFYGVQTLRQLLPPITEWEAAFPRPISVPYARIEDLPRFQWRGAMLDVARHFFSVDEVKRYIDLLAMYKINRLHLHLADDQGWRIEIPEYPRLTEHGGSTEVGGGPGGFYTTEDYEELVRYAAEHHMAIVPEIDTPGHTNAALASVPELNCDGRARELYTGTRVGFSAVCVDREETYEWVDAVVGHLAAITPTPWIHMGGDEVEELTQEEYNLFIERVEEIVRSHGKTMVGWQEINAADIDDASMLQWWHGDGSDVADAAPGQLIVSPAHRIYVDMQYHPGTPIGLDWAAIVPLRDAYDWEPATAVPGLDPAAIVGLEAPLWAETIADMGDVEYLAFPRLAAVAELAWSREADTDWGDFRKRLAAHGLRWTALGVNFYRAPEVDWEEW